MTNEHDYGQLLAQPWQLWTTLTIANQGGWRRAVEKRGADELWQLRKDFLLPLAGRKGFRAQLATLSVYVGPPARPHYHVVMAAPWRQLADESPASLIQGFWPYGNTLTEYFETKERAAHVVSYVLGRKNFTSEGLHNRVFLSGANLFQRAADGHPTAAL